MSKINWKTLAGKAGNTMLSLAATAFLLLVVMLVILGSVIEALVALALAPALLVRELRSRNEKNT